MAEETTQTLTAPAAAPVTAPKPVKGPDRAGFWWGTGRRKTAVARVRIKPGNGAFLVNGKEGKVFFTELRDQQAIVVPLSACKLLGQIDVHCNVRGGGYASQAAAVLLGLARALRDYDPSLEPILREHSMLTRDAREVERKKYGQAGARRRFQFSKR